MIHYGASIKSVTDNLHWTLALHQSVVADENYCNIIVTGANNDFNHVHRLKMFRQVYFLSATCTETIAPLKNSLFFRTFGTDNNNMSVLQGIFLN